MGREIRITEEVVLKVQELMNSGVSFTGASENLGATTDGIRGAAKRYGITLNIDPCGRKNQIEPLLREMMPRIIEQRMSTYEISGLIGFTQPAIYKCLRRMGISLQPRKCNQEDTQRKAERILNDLIKNGGYVRDAAQRLGIKIDPHVVRVLAKAKGIDIRQFRYANEVHGQWQVQVGPFERRSASDVMVSCKCLGCGVIEPRSLSNLRSGRTKSCRNCSAAARPNTMAVRCVEDGNTFNSIRAFAIDRASLKNYQALRLKLIHSEDGRLVHEGLTYELVKH